MRCPQLTGKPQGPRLELWAQACSAGTWCKHALAVNMEHFAESVGTGFCQCHFGPYQPVPCDILAFGHKLAS